MSRTNARIAILLACIVGLADAFFKQIALARFPLDGSRVSFPLGFSLHKNPGIAFDIPIPLPIVFFLTTGVSIWLAHRLFVSWRKQNFEEAASCAFVLVGAYGNLVDRIAHGFTTDYLILFRLSAINLSDVLILIGMIGFLWYYSHNPQNTRS